MRLWFNSDLMRVTKWFIAFPQIVSRVGHSNEDVYKHLSRLIAMVLQEYPKQALWLFMSVVKSTKAVREQRGRSILDRLRVGLKIIVCSRLTAECSVE